MAQSNLEPTLDDWKRKICESFDAGIAMSSDDLEGALLAFIKDNQRLNKLLNSMVQEFSKVVVPRLMNKDEGDVLAALDNFIAERTSVVNPVEGSH